MTRQEPAYAIGSGWDSDHFEIDGTILKLRTIPDISAKSFYTVNITSAGGFGQGNSRTFDIIVNADPGGFITIWQTTSPSESITIPVGGVSGTYTIEWGDGTIHAGVSGDQTHLYDAPGNYTVRIYGDFTRLYLNNDDNARKLLSIEQWGDIEWISMNSAFKGASNMKYNAADAPDLSRVTDMAGMFDGASSFDGDLSKWDVSSVTDMSGMFEESVSFNSDLSKWDVSSVADMSLACSPNAVLLQLGPLKVGCLVRGPTCHCMFEECRTPSTRTSQSGMSRP